MINLTTNITNPLDILTGQLRQTDAHVLRPFLVDE